MAITYKNQAISNDPDDMIPMRIIAKEWRISPGNASRFARVHGCEPRACRLGAGNKLANALSRKDVEYLTQLRGKELLLQAPGEQWGYFYAVCLMPDIAPNRIKLGFSEEMKLRMRHYASVSPNAKLVKVWPCMRRWEMAVMDSATLKGCRAIKSEAKNGEVFDVDNIDDLIRRVSKFLYMLPRQASLMETKDIAPIEKECIK